MKKQFVFVCMLLPIFLSTCSKKNEFIEKVGENEYITNLIPKKYKDIRPNVILTYSHTLEGPFLTATDLVVFDHYYLILERNPQKLTLYDQKTQQKKEYIINELKYPNRIIYLQGNNFIIEDSHRYKFCKLSFQPKNENFSMDDTITKENIYLLSFFKDKLLGIKKEKGKSHIVFLDDQLEIQNIFLSFDSDYIIYQCYPDGLVVADIMNYHIWNYDWKGLLKENISLSNQELLKSKGRGFFNRFNFPYDNDFTSPAALNRIWIDYDHEKRLRIILQTNLKDKKDVFYYYDIFIEGKIIARIPYNYNILCWNYNRFYFADKEKNIRCLESYWKED